VCHAQTVRFLVIKDPKSDRCLIQSLLSSNNCQWAGELRPGLNPLEERIISPGNSPDNQIISLWNVWFKGKQGIRQESKALVNGKQTELIQVCDKWGIPESLTKIQGRNTKLQDHNLVYRTKYRSESNGKQNTKNWSPISWQRPPRAERKQKHMDGSKLSPDTNNNIQKMSEGERVQFTWWWTKVNLMNRHGNWLWLYHKQVIKQTKTKSITVTVDLIKSRYGLVSQYYTADPKYCH